MQFNKAVIFTMSWLIFFPAFVCATPSPTSNLPHPNDTLAKKVKSKRLDSKWRPIGQFVLHPGSLRKNIQRIAKRFGWDNVIWIPDSDYQWAGKTKFINERLPDILNKVLKSYPLQAVFYQGNHVLVISPRNIK